MAEQIPIVSNNYQDDNQHLVVENQQNPENIQNIENPQNPENIQNTENPQNPGTKKLPQNMISCLTYLGLYMVLKFYGIFLPGLLLPLVL